jgi:multiple sugar transport system permease protein
MAAKRAGRGESLSAQRTLQVATIHAVLIFFSVLFIFPLFWMLSTAVKPIEETMKSPPVWIPSEFQWGNFWEAIAYGSDTLGYIPFGLYAVNTFALAILVVSATVASNAIVAYSFARLRWPGRDFAFALTLATMMVPFPVLMVPIFQLFKELGWVGTFRPLWVPALFGSAFNIYLLTQFFKTIPFELSEAARIDGCSDWGIFTKIILPLAVPALAVVALFSFMGSINDFLGPLIYLLDQKTFTLSLGLQAFQSQHGGTKWNLLMAASSIVIAPIIILFFFTQRLFIQGIAVTGLKG